MPDTMRKAFCLHKNVFISLRFFDTIPKRSLKNAV
uniref:Uncharacterized protein n=3 Tax=Neisseria meningitidis TaxID=487 RepID=C6SHB0_NEIME|nr:hypothetical protein predicted by Glimmer/Critica [Neisseria meningitidis alpha275]CCA44325.1 hypothetical protein NMALPHA522_0784 [Neisseria meningitidis alpha522]